MESIVTIITFLISFLIITIAAERISKKFQQYGIPLISGFLLVGIVCGPYVLNLIDKETASGLFFVNDISLAFIAFAASSELYLKELRSRINSIKWLAIGQLGVTFTIIMLFFMWIADYIPYLSDQTAYVQWSIAALSAAVLCARSPASVIAVINEMRAKGPFSSTVLGTTVLVDFLVIVLFAISFAIVSAFVHGQPFTIGFLGLLLLEISTSLLAGILIGLVLKSILMVKIRVKVKAVLVVLTGFSAYGLYYAVEHYAASGFGLSFHLEPLLICLMGSFYVVNYTNQRHEFLSIIHLVSPYIYAVFFTYAGALLAVDVIPKVWKATLLVFLINGFALFMGTYLGGVLGKEKFRYASRYWTSFLTQAGVGLGLATIVANAFEPWGAQFSAIIISVIVLNQLVGPIVFKRAIVELGESRARAETPEFDGIRDAIIVGYESQSVALARQLQSHGWQAKIATRKPIDSNDHPDLNIIKIDGLTLDALESLDARLTEAFVLMLTDKENLILCEMIYRHIGTKEVVVRLNDRENFDTFHKLGALIVDPGTAMVSLLDHFVRSPQAASLLLGLQQGQDTIDLEVLNPDLFGAYLRDLRLPSDIIILAVHRKGQMIISHGYTRLRKGDMMTMVGSEESLRRMTDLFDANV